MCLWPGIPVRQHYKVTMNEQCHKSVPILMTLDVARMLQTTTNKLSILTSCSRESCTKSNTSSTKAIPNSGWASWSNYQSSDSVHSWQFNRTALLEAQVTVTINWYPTLSHYSNTEPSSSCSTLLTPCIRLVAIIKHCLRYWFHSDITSHIISHPASVLTDLHITSGCVVIILLFKWGYCSGKTAPYGR